MFKRNKNIPLVAFILLISLKVNSQWIAQNLPTNSNLNAIYLVNENSGWIVGDDGTMFYKLKNEWRKYSKITDENIYSLWMIDINNGWAVGSHGTILNFSAGKWQNYPSPTDEKMNSVCFTDKDHGVAVGDNGTMLVYENCIWTKKERKIIGHLYSVAACSDLSIVSGGRESISIPLMKLSGNYELMPLKSSERDYFNIRSIAFQDLKNLWAVGLTGSIYHSDGNRTEQIHKFEKLPTLNSIHFSEGSRGMAVGHAGIILTFSENDWTIEESPVDLKLNSAFISGNTYCAVGDKGTVVTKKIRSGTGTEGLSNDNRVIRTETYPNPASDILNFYIPVEEGFLPEQISISNSSGKLVYNASIDPSLSGQVQQLDISEYNNGLYLINITTSGNKKATGKFIVRH
jgi:photosystem II stability/assembly factor-like uncharacterized protein